MGDLFLRIICTYVPRMLIMHRNVAGFLPAILALIYARKIRKVFVTGI